MAICAICARDLNCREHNIKAASLQDLPNMHQLIPHTKHPKHDLYEGKLLDPMGVSIVDGVYMVKTCHQCRVSLEKDGPDLPPALSLANNLWIGQVPLELSCLTFPEQLLIAHLYPRVYVFKLFPKKGFTGDSSRLQRGMRGTVTTYELDQTGISSMLEDNLMPWPPQILASFLSVTFIGLGQLPKKWLLSLFRVRRLKVMEALQWLKQNNQKYYGDINIDLSRLMKLPEDDIPVEIEGIVRQSTDVGIILQESEGYVPLDDEEGDPTCLDEQDKPAMITSSN